MNIDTMWRYILPISCGLGAAVFLVSDRIQKRGIFGNALDVAKEAFYGGRWITCNIVTAAMAISCVLSPSLVIETLYISTINALCLLIARTVCLLLCFWLWHKIAQLGFDNYFDFLSFRYNNSLASAVYLINSFLCFLYILLVYNGPLLHSQMDHFKLNSADLTIFIGFALLCSFGGLRVALPLCSILTIFEVCGSTLLLIKVQKFNATSSIDVDQQYRCLSHIPLHLFAVAFPLLLTAQPIYKLFYHLNSHKKATTTMGLGYCIFLLKFLLAFFIVRPIYSHSRALKLKESQAFRSAFINLSENDTIPGTDARAFVLREGTITNLGDFTLDCVAYGPMAAFYCLRLCQLAGELSERIIPFLQSKSPRLTGIETQYVYSSTYCLLACLISVGLLSANRNIPMPEYRHLTLYFPHIITSFMIAVSTMIALGVLMPALRLAHILSAWGITVITTAIPMFTALWNGYNAVNNEIAANWEISHVNTWICLGVWTNFVCVVVNTSMIFLLVGLSGGRKALSLRGICKKSETDGRKTNQKRSVNRDDSLRASKIFE